jgi:hypothetical protein
LNVRISTISPTLAHDASGLFDIVKRIFGKAPRRAGRRYVCYQGKHSGLIRTADDGASFRNLPCIASLTATMALRFGKAFRISEDTLLRMQAAYDWAQARLRKGELDIGPT